MAPKFPKKKKSSPKFLLTTSFLLASSLEPQFTEKVDFMSRELTSVRVYYK